jgi:predicted type IV restriction endonuclease
MGYDKGKIYKQACKIAKKENIMLTEHLIANLPVSISTFYEFFPADSEEMEVIKGIINRNKIKKKQEMYNKWFESENATLQVSLMKLLGNEEERAVLNNSKQEIEHKISSKTTPSITFTSAEDTEKKEDE